MNVLWFLSVFILSATTQEQDGVDINIIQDKIVLDHETDPFSYEVSCQVGKSMTEVLNMTLTNQGNSIVIINSNVTDTTRTGYFDSGNLTSNLSAGYLKIQFVAVSPQVHFGSFNCAVAGVSRNETIIRWNTTPLRLISKPLIEVDKTQRSGRVELNVICSTTASCLEVSSMGFHANNITQTVNNSTPTTCERLKTIKRSKLYVVNETFLCLFGINVGFNCSVNYKSNNSAQRVRRSVNSDSLFSDMNMFLLYSSEFGMECTYNDSCKTSSAFCDTKLPKPICKCPADLYYDKVNDRCTNIEPCPENSNYIYFKDRNVCYTIKSSSTNDSWDKVCSEEYAVALPLHVKSACGFTSLTDCGPSIFTQRPCNDLMLNTNPSDAKTFQIVISTDHSLVMNKPQWFLPSGERLVDFIPEPDNDWVSSPSSCLYILYDSRNSSVRMSPDCNFIEPSYKGCFIQLPNESCDVDELNNYTWNYTRGGVQVNQSCPTTHKGQVTRECQFSGVWKPPYYNCTLKSLEDIKANLTQGIINPSEAMINLVNELPVNVNGSDKTNTTLYIGDLIKIKEILELVTYNMSNTSVQETENFLTIASFVVDKEENGDAWKSRVENVGKGAEEFLSVVDNFIAKATESLQNNNQSSLNITKQNLVLQYAKIEPSNPSSIVFPTALENDPKWNTTATSSVFLNYTAFYDQGVTAYSVVLYRNLSQSVPSTLSERPNNKDISVNSQVLSIQMLPKAPNPLNPNIELTFRGFQNMDKAEKHCSFWKLNETSNSSSFGTWSTDGCREIFSNSTHVQCVCSHLSNFALLISPFVPPEEHVRILGIISIVGISISMAALLITIGIHALHWRLVKSDNSIMLVSLCIVLLVGNALFLGGVNRTDKVVGCKIIAAVLHYLFLVAFFLMLSEGVKIFIKIVFIFNKTSYLVHMLAVSFVVPLIIVGISLGVTKLEGYGDDKFCWLSRENGVFWAFAGPSGLVILINFVVIGLLTKIMCRRRPGVDKSILQKAKLTAIKLMVIVPILGISWISGLLSVDEDSMWLQYVFCIFNSLQGVAIMIFHVIRNTQLHKAIQAQRARKKSLEDFTSSSKASNFHIELKEKIKARFGIKQSSSTTMLASNTSTVNLTDDEKSPPLNQKSTPERTTDIDNNKIDDLNLKDDYNSGYSPIRDGSELKTFRREVPETVSHTGTTSTEKLIDNINDVEVKPNTKKYNIDKTKSETEIQSPYSLDDQITFYDNNISNDD